MNRISGFLIGFLFLIAGVLWLLAAVMDVVTGVRWATDAGLGGIALTVGVHQLRLDSSEVYEK